MERAHTDGHEPFRLLLHDLFFLLAATAPLCSEEPSPQAIAVSGVPEKELELSLKHNGISKNLSRSLILFLGFSSV